jgi:hypothetical protein
MSYPRVRWYSRLVVTGMNALKWLSGSSFRAFYKNMPMKDAR